MSVFYTGIGSRETPRHICIYMSKVAKILDKRGYILRSGGAQGADKAFQSSATNPIIYRGNSHIPQWAIFLHTLIGLFGMITLKNWLLEI